MNAYLNLAALLEGTEAEATGVVQAALDEMPPTIFAVTLDLEASIGLLSPADVEALVSLIRGRWPRPAFCLARCREPLAWSQAAARLSQPLLAWGELAKQGGYHTLGRAPTGRYAELLRALCYRHERATAEQLARDPQIVSPETGELRCPLPDGVRPNGQASPGADACRYRHYRQ